jgi:fumarate hydratase subunit beta
MEESLRLEGPWTKEKLSGLRAGDRVLLSGEIWTARDAAHQRIVAALEKGEPLPFSLSGSLLFYAGPCPAPPGRVIGSVAPTTSGRMDVFFEAVLKAGSLGAIGKGERAPYVRDLCKKYGAVYFLGYGGAAAVTSSCIKTCEEAAWPDLGAESVKRLTVENMPLIVGIDAAGNDFIAGERKKWENELIGLDKK